MTKIDKRMINTLMALLAISITSLLLYDWRLSANILSIIMLLIASLWGLLHICVGFPTILLGLHLSSHFEKKHAYILKSKSKILYYIGRSVYVIGGIFFYYSVYLYVMGVLYFLTFNPYTMIQLFPIETDPIFPQYIMINYIN